MSLLDENIEIPFEDLLIGNGWKKESGTTYIYQRGLVTNIKYTYESNDVNDRKYRITYYPKGSYIYGKRIKRSVVNVECSISVYDYNSNDIRVRCDVGRIYIRCKQSELLDLWVRVRNGIFDPKLYKMYR